MGWFLEKPGWNPTPECERFAIASTRRRLGKSPEMGAIQGLNLCPTAFIPEYTVLERGCWIGAIAVPTKARDSKSPDANANLRGAYMGVGALIGAGSGLMTGVRWLGLIVE